MEDLLYVHKKEPFKELLRVTPKGEVYLEGKYVGQSDELKETLTEYAENVKKTYEGLERINKILKQFPK